MHHTDDLVREIIGQAHPGARLVDLHHSLTRLSSTASGHSHNSPLLSPSSTPAQSHQVSDGLSSKGDARRASAPVALQIPKMSDLSRSADSASDASRGSAFLRDPATAGTTQAGAAQAKASPDTLPTAPAGAEGAVKKPSDDDSTELPTGVAATEAGAESLPGAVSDVMAEPPSSDERAQEGVGTADAAPAGV
jgi:hypothetical protein